MPNQLSTRSLVGSPRLSDGSRSPAQQRTYEPGSESGVVGKHPSQDEMRSSPPIDTRKVSNRPRSQSENPRQIDRLIEGQLPDVHSQQKPTSSGDIEAPRTRIREKRERNNASIARNEGLKREVSRLRELREVQNIEKKLADITTERDQVKAENDSLKADIADGVSLVNETAEAQGQLQDWTRDLVNQILSIGHKPTQKRKPTVWGPRPPPEDEEPESGN
ncbi:hypothetical protein HII31_05693 [Pseudocercospora fuligena]|uniref:Uncharacterized protein n=1 Tax=Pseudocercospora fuligena TaxID=685502 RepID=A0A8H6RL77_9PEZI|nr:hypothetical protein HII31_05693 [Pseudocercospora fuligena]